MKFKKKVQLFFFSIIDISCITNVSILCCNIIRSSVLTNAHKMGIFFTLTYRMVVAILEEVNNHADFKPLKDSGCSYTIYQNAIKTQNC